MTAQELFRELGYQKLPPELSDGTILYVRYTDESNVEFFLDCKTVYFFVEDYNDYGLKVHRSMEIDTRLYIAIGQQMKELGWIE